MYLYTKDAKFGFRSSTSAKIQYGLTVTVTAVRLTEYDLRLRLQYVFLTGPEVSLTSHAGLKESYYETMNIAFGLRALLKK